MMPPFRGRSKDRHDAASEVRFTNMKMRLLIIAFGLASLACLAAEPTRANIVFILADDMGWADLGRYDLGEQHDLAKEMPDNASALRDQLHAWRDSVGAALPMANPDFKGGKLKPMKTQVAP